MPYSWLKQLDDDKASSVYKYIYIYKYIYCKQINPHNRNGFFYSKINFEKLSNLMPCINKLYLVYTVKYVEFIFTTIK